MRLSFDEIAGTLERILAGRGCCGAQARKVACEMTRNSLEGIYSHGVNRFARLVRNIDEGIVKPNVMPEKVNGFGAIENYDGGLGLGITNAWFCMDRAIELAREHGIGLVAIRNTNHWLRAATYGYQACDAGMAAICFTNTMPNMPTWGAQDSRIGNNPLVFAFPRKGGHVIADMAMSQFSYGALEVARLAGRQMPIDAGFDRNGELTRDPDEVIATQRILPTGYWKGAALSFLLDTFAGCLSLGNTVAGVGRLEGDEHGVSQVFMAIDYQKIAPAGQADAILEDAVQNLLGSKPAKEGDRIIYTGQLTDETRERNLKEGIPVDESVWKTIMTLAEKD